MLIEIVHTGRKMPLRKCLKCRDPCALATRSGDPGFHWDNEEKITRAFFLLVLSCWHEQRIKVPIYHWLHQNTKFHISCLTVKGFEKILAEIESRLIRAISCSGNCIMHASSHHQTHFGRYNQANYSVFLRTRHELLNKSIPGENGLPIFLL